jgi:hypothetical protein
LPLQTPEQQARMKDDLRVNKVREPVIVTRDGRVVHGAWRVIHAAELGLKTVPVIVVPNIPDDELAARQ